MQPAHSADSSTTAGTDSSPRPLGPPLDELPPRLTQPFGYPSRFRALSRSPRSVVSSFSGQRLCQTSKTDGRTTPQLHCLARGLHSARYAVRAVPPNRANPPPTNQRNSDRRGSSTHYPVCAPRVSCRRPAQILGSGFSLGLTSVPTLCKGILLHGLNRTNPAMLQPPNEGHCLEAQTRSLTPGDPPRYRLSPCAVLECVLRAPSDGFQDASRVNSRVTNPVSRLSRPPARFSYPGPAATKKEALMLTPATLIPS